MRRPAYRKKGYKKSNRMKRRAYKKMRRSNIIRLTRNVQLEDFVVQGSVPNTTVTRSYSFWLGQLDNYTEFTSLFEKYRIKAVKLQMIPAINTNVPGNTYLPVIASCLQTSSDVVPSSLVTFMEQDNVRITRSNKTISWYVRPFLDAQIYQSTVSSGQSPRRGVWVNTDDYTVPHYGVNVLGELPTVGPFGPTEYQRYKVFAKFYMEFAGTH